MELTDEDVLEILNLIEQSHFDFFRLESGDLNLTVSKGGYVPTALGTASVAGQDKAPGTPLVEPVPVPAAPAPRQEISAEETRAREGLVPITASMVGTFYRAPEPGAAPFVEVGARVDEDTTVGLIEVMKVFTSIPAGLTGTIAEIVATNAQFVEKGELLFCVTPDDAPGRGGDRQ